MCKCGDYKVTVNSVLDIEQYPLPRPEEIFAKLANGKKFTDLDLSHAYNQLLLESESRKLVTINTLHGLLSLHKTSLWDRLGTSTVSMGYGYDISGSTGGDVLYR